MHFVAFFHVASLFLIGVDNEKVGVFFSFFFLFQPDFNVEISPKNVTKHPVAWWHYHAKHSGLNSIFCCLK